MRLIIITAILLSLSSQLYAECKLVDDRLNCSGEHWDKVDNGYGKASDKEWKSERKKKTFGSYKKKDCKIIQGEIVCKEVD